MNYAVLAQFRAYHEAMNPEPMNWQWIGQHMSQRMFGITEKRAKAYATLYGGTASPLEH
jgi:hypothetical protein